jgi:hypothetical protein
MLLDTIATRYILYCFNNYGHFVSYIESLSWQCSPLYFVSRGFVEQNRTPSVSATKIEKLFISYGGFLPVMQWAEVLSADAFSAFEDAGLDNNKVYLILVALNALTLV